MKRTLRLALALVAFDSMDVNQGAAVMVRVDWSAPVSGHVDGVLSGSFGSFDVTPTGTSLFPLLGNGSLLVTGSGFMDEPLNTSRPFTEGDATLRFWNGIAVGVNGSGDSLITDPFSGGVRPNGSHPCSDVCGITLSATDVGIATISLRDMGGSGSASSGTVVLSTTVIPEPSTALLLGVGLGAFGLSRRQRRRAGISIESATPSASPSRLCQARRLVYSISLLYRRLLGR